ncbi:MAG: transcription-repair coupling factor [Peptococcaceae bacterium]|jgi:transcription-repair coupling factor (superfamily II helicase)|nr:transcription-repair coupling factor [Peptococcaceae bacterium]
MQGIADFLAGLPEWRSVARGLSDKARQQLVFGAGGAVRGFLMAGWADHAGAVLVITPQEADAQSLAEDLKNLLPGRQVLLFPSWPLLTFQVVAQGREALAGRLAVLRELCRNASPVVVAPVEAVLRRLTPRPAFCRQMLTLAEHMALEPGVLFRTLVDLGYERVERVEEAGRFAGRGGIVDVFPAAAANPVRLEFEGDELAGLREFEVSSQRSRGRIDSLILTPARELVMDEDTRAAGAKEMQRDYQAQLKRLARSATVDAYRRLASRWEELTAALAGSDRSLEQYLPYFYPDVSSLADYLPPDSLVILDDPVRLQEVVAVLWRERTESFTTILDEGRAMPGQLDTYLRWGETLASLTRHRSVACMGLVRKVDFLKPENVVTVTARALGGFLGHAEVLTDEIRHWRRTGKVVVICAGTAARAGQIADSLRDRQIEAVIADWPGLSLHPGHVVVAPVHYSGGFELPGLNLVVLTEAEVYGRRKVRRRTPSGEGQASRLDDLKAGDYVVHASHGIGRFRGIVQMEIGGMHRDYLLVQYAGEDKLYVPTDQLSLVGRYTGGEGEAPRLSRLGGQEWTKAKARVREAVQEMARELLALYAARESVPGYAFGPDTVWQQEFEATFPYEETPDQVRAIAEVKEDMEKGRPMDRLLCGDVGYGKTEVALRAAFKAVMDGKQVAILVPTTILAQQHFTTFRERLAGFPVRVESLSRFRTGREQRQVVEGLARGTVDIVIGTHRLVQEDVRFSDLGLLVVDEEQRFGVSHKERLKMLRKNVDVLTLTATPIPRTLHMSMIGVRDTSILESPPDNRFPVQTYVLEEDPLLVREAIRRELGRGGQVYFVHNRIMELDTVASQLHELVPEARVAVAHGQMREDDLEDVMLQFIDGACDVLLCTSIIESGLDIPNVNTLVVKNADRLGLSQLYQLRGRIGRGSRLAYAYLTFQRDRVLSEVAEKRLSAVREFTEFGSGYRIALRDLEIRGAGNLLGMEQHGHIAAVGFEMYTRLLAEAVREARGIVAEQTVETSFELNAEAYIPDGYVTGPDQKVEIYRRLASVRAEEEVAAVREEVADRFGPLPLPVETLFQVARIRLKAGALKVLSVSRQTNYYRLRFSGDHALRGDQLVRVAAEYGSRIKFIHSAGTFEIRMTALKAERETTGTLGRIESFLDRLTDDRPA